MRRWLGVGVTLYVIMTFVVFLSSFNTHRVFWALYFGAAVFGLGSQAYASVWSWNFVRRRCAVRSLAVPLAIVAAALTYLLLWIVFDVVWVAGLGVRSIRWLVDNDPVVPLT